MNNDRIFFEAKKSALNKLDQAMIEKKVDSSIIPLLDIINKSDDYYTSSSCAGRIVLIEMPVLGDKKMLFS